MDDGDGEESLLALNKGLIRSRTFDSINVQNYRRNLNLQRVVPSGQVIERVAISSVDINGVQEFFGPFDIGEVYGEDFTPQPINWLSVHAEFEQRMRQRGLVKYANRWRPIKPNTSDTSDAAVQLGVQTTGVYRLTYQDLLERGVDWAGIPVREIAITTDGEPVPRRISNAKRRLFGPGSSIDFVGVKPDDRLSIYQAERWYRVQRDATKARPVRSIKRGPKSPKDWHYKSQTLQADNQHVIFSPLETPWVMDLIFRTSSPASVTYEFELPAMVDGPTSEVEVSLGGIANAPRQDFDGDGALDPHHLVSILVNGQLVASSSFDGQRSRTVTALLPSKVLKMGSNTVQVRVEHSGYDFDVAVIEAVSLRYPVSNQGTRVFEFSDASDNNDGLLFRPERRRGLVAYAYRDDHNLMRIKPSRAATRGLYQVPFVANGASRYFIGDQSALKKPPIIQRLAKSEPIELNDTNMLVISHPHFIGDALEDYVVARRLQGVDSLIVSTDRIKRNFGADVPLHIAIKRFLQDADQKIDYQHALLVGGHTSDYLRRQHEDSISFIPTFYRAIGSSRFTPSDQPFVDFNGDGLPEKSLGRWPVRERAHVATIAHKSLTWASAEAARQQTGHGVLLLADQRREFDFAADLDAHFSKLSGIEIGAVDRVYVDRVAEEPGLEPGTLNGVVQQRVFEGFADAKSWVFYNGHASPNAWSFSQMLAASEVVGLENQNAPVFITSLGCYTTYYESPSHNSLALQLLFAGNNAAAAIYGPAVVGGYQSQLRLANLVAEQMKTGQSIGEAIRLGMHQLPTNIRAPISNSAYLGDPSLPAQ